MGCFARPATPAFVFAAMATLLMLLVTLSAPLLKTISIIQATVSSAGTETVVKFGTLGYCIQVVNATGEECAPTHFGYDFGESPDRTSRRGSAHTGTRPQTHPQSRPPARPCRPSA